jgi:cell division protein FtsI/penicillin-binding protein 2
MTPRRIDIVALVAVAAMTLLLALLLARVAQLQIRTPPRLAEHMHPRETVQPIAPLRGDIVDRRGRPLAATEFGYRAFVDPLEFPSDSPEALLALADALGISAESLAERITPRQRENARRAASSPRGGPHGGSTSSVGAILDRIITVSRTTPGPNLASESPSEPESLKPIRYVRVSGILQDDALARVKALTDHADKARHVPGIHLELRDVRNYPAGELVASIIGRVATDKDDYLGVERTQDRRLGGIEGRIRYVRDVMGRPLWMGPGTYVPPEPGRTLRLSIDLELQRMAYEELERGVNDADAAGGRLVAMDPLSGEILAMADIIRPVPGAVPYEFEDAAPRRAPEPDRTGERPRYIVIKPDPTRAVHPSLGRNRCIEDVYEPGSTFKSVVWAAVTELGRASLGEVFNTGGGVWTTPYGRTVRDVHARPAQTWREVLVNSSNIGMSQSVQRLSFDELRAAVLRFGFGRPTGIGLPGEAAGVVTPRAQWTKYTQTSVSFGAEIAATPLQMVRAYSVFARPDELAGTLPPARLLALDHDDPERSVACRVISAATAETVKQIERTVAANMEALMLARDKTATGWRYSMFGKSGTAKISMGKPPPGKRWPTGSNGYFERQYFSSFIAAGPVEQPRLVILVIIDDPGPDLVRQNRYYGSNVAGPVVRRLMDRALAYLGAPPSASTAPAVKPPASGAD